MQSCDIYVSQSAQQGIFFQKLLLWRILILQADEEAGRPVPNACECPLQKLDLIIFSFHCW